MNKPNIKIGHHDLYSWFNSFAIYLQEHVMCEHFLLLSMSQFAPRAII